jgi:hypothetical protein
MTKIFEARDYSLFALRSILPLVLVSILFVAALIIHGPGNAAAMEQNASSTQKSESGSTGPKVLLELFTSQGCSSCPRADALLPDFIARKDVIAISMSIDYWDYLGWRDTFGQAIFTDRQKSYGKRIGDGIIYTPQIVVDGRAHLNGSDRKAIEAMIDQRKKERAQNGNVVLDVETHDDMLVVSVGETPKGMKVSKATLWMALFSKSKSVKVRRGENSGRLLTYHNVVRELAPIGRWTGQEMVLKLPKKQIMQRGADGCVILLQNGDGGPIVAAAQMPTW